MRCRLACVAASLAAVVAGVASAAMAEPPRVAGCPVFPADNAWNRRVDRLPVAQGSAAVVRAISLDGRLHADFGSGLWEGGPIGIPITVVGASTPRSRVVFETSLPNIHSLSAAAIDEVRIIAGEQRAVRIEVEMNNSAGVFQVDELMANKLRGSGLEDHVEFVARIDAEHEKRLLRVYQI